MYENVLLPTDGSDGARRAAEQGIELARSEGATVHVLYVVDVTDTSSYRTGSMIEALEDRGREATEAIAEHAADRGVEAYTEVRPGIPHRTILEYADDSDVDLIVMGTHGRTGLDRYLIGSVTEKVVRLSDVPVLTVPIESADEE